MSIEDEPTDPAIGLARIAALEWEPEMAEHVWADVSHWHPLIDADAYGAANKPGLIGIKVAECGLPARMGREMVLAAEARGLIVVGYQYGCTNPERFVELFPPKPGRIHCIDFEGTTATLANLEHCIEVIEAQTGRAPWLYFGGQEWRRCSQPAGTGVERCPSWQSQYGPHLRPLQNVGKLVAWQYSGGTNDGPEGAPKEHAGVSGPLCDMSTLLCSLEELWLMAGALQPPRVPTGAT